MTIGGSNRNPVERLRLALARERRQCGRHPGDHFDCTEAQQGKVPLHWEALHPATITIPGSRLEVRHIPGADVQQAWVVRGAREFGMD